MREGEVRGRRRLEKERESPSKFISKKKLRKKKEKVLLKLFLDPP
jgi:hypothetical protein